MKRYIIGGTAAVLAAGGLITAAPQASAGCVNPGLGPLSQMCDSPVDSDGMWDRCLTYYPNGPMQPAEIDCYPMSPGDPPKANPVLSNPPTHID